MSIMELHRLFLAGSINHFGGNCGGRRNHAANPGRMNGLQGLVLIKPWGGIS